MILDEMKKIFGSFNTKFVLRGTKLAGFKGGNDKKFRLNRKNV